MRFPVHVHSPDAKYAYGPTFPVFPGGFAAPVERADLTLAIGEVVTVHLHGEPKPIRVPTRLEPQVRDAQHSGGTWLPADASLSRTGAWAGDPHRPQSGDQAQAMQRAICG